MTQVVLGSASPGRLKVLRQAGIDPLVVASGIDENAVTADLGAHALPDDVVCALAAAKTDAVVQLLSPEVAADCVVIGCDSMLFIDGQLCGKPDSMAAARNQWHSMAGRSGELHTGHCVTRLQHRDIISHRRESAATTVYFGTPSEPDLTAYLDSVEPLRVAGSFTIDGLGGWFIDGVDGDPTNVVGLSLPLLRSLLSRAGLSVGDLWATNPVA
jgi:septum formation protein